MKKYDTVIFDLDGTLLDTLQDIADSVNYVLSKYSCPVKTVREVCAYVGNGTRLLLERAIPDGSKNPKFDEMYKEYLSHYKAHCNDKTAPYEGISEMLSGLKARGYKLAIVSNKFDSAVKEMSKLYFGDVMSAAIGENEAQGIKKKPAPDTVLQALSELGSEKERSVFVGDSEVDFMTAQNSGLDCVSVLWGFRDKQFLSECGASVFASTPEELLEIIESK